jgi:hypothetical protein
MISQTETKGNTGGKNEVAEKLVDMGGKALNKIYSGVNGENEEEGGNLLKTVVEKGKKLLGKKEIKKEDDDVVIEIKNKKVKKENLKKSNQIELKETVIKKNILDNKKVTKKQDEKKIVNIVPNALEVLKDGLIDQDETEDLVKKIVGENSITNLISDIVITGDE